MNDPERVARRPKLRHEYALRGRVKCGLCGAAMVGHTMVDRGRPYHYYHCRITFDRRTGRECSGRNVRADRLEAAIWREIRAKLSSPEIILQEVQRGRPAPNLEEVDRLEQELGRIGERERRLVKLYSYGEIDEALVQPGLTEFKQQRTVIEARLREIRPNLSPAAPPLPDAGLLDRACRAVGDFLDNAGPEEHTLALEALQIAVRATTTEAEITGIVPIDSDSYLHTNGHADACCSVINRLVSVSRSA